VTGQRAVAPATGVLFVAVVIAVVVVTGHYPRTGDSALAVWFAALVGSFVAGRGAARVFPAMSHEPPATRVAATLFVGFLFGGMALAVLYIVGIVVFTILLSGAA